jgi:hypothetical protein
MASDSWMSAAPSSMPGKMWQCTSTIAGYRNPFPAERSWIALQGEALP